MSDLIGQVSQTISSKRLFKDGQPLVVAVSGGLDSMVLLDVLRRLSGEHRWILIVAHFNHLLRGGSSDADEAFVRGAAKSLGLKFVRNEADVKGYSLGHKLSVEMAARKLRHDFLARACVDIGARTVALAHHADDQVELFFLRLLRGAGGEGLAGMEWASPSPSLRRIRLVRPLLGATKEELLVFAERQGISFREDASNAWLDYERNRIRHGLLPRIREEFQPALTTIILRLMEIVGAESDFAERAAGEWEPDRKDNRFDRLHVAVQRQWLRLGLLKLGLAPDFDLIESLRMDPDRRVMVRPDLNVWRDEQGRLQTGTASEPAFNSERTVLDLSAPVGHVLFGGLDVSWRIDRCPDSRRRLSRGSAACEFFDAQKVGPRIILRHWQPGDRFQPIGMKHDVKLQDLFTNQKIFREKRHQLVVAATDGEEIFWVEGLRISERFKLVPDTTRRLFWRWKRG